MIPCPLSSSHRYACSLFYLPRNHVVVRYIILLSFHWRGGTSWRNTRLTPPSPLTPHSPPVCRLRHCSWCFIVHRQLHGETSTDWLYPNHASSFLSSSREGADGCGSAGHGPVRPGASWRGDTCWQLVRQAPHPQSLPTAPLCFTSSQGFFLKWISQASEKET